MNTFIFPSRNRLGVHFETLIPSIPRIRIVEYLEKNDFLITQHDIISLARSQLGKNYKRGSSIKDQQTFDCSSLTQWLYGQVGIYIPRISIDQRDFGEPVNLDDIRSGDLVFTTGYINYYWDNEELSGVGHVGIFTGESIIHAANKTRGVVEDTLEDFLKDDIRGVVRIHEYLSKLDTVTMPKDKMAEYDAHLRWRILRALS